MIAKRLLAVLVAVGLVAGAWALRQSRQGDDGGSGGGDTPGQDGGLVWCSTELAAACDALEGAGYTVDVAPAGEQAKAFESPTPPDVDAWITLDPWPAIVDSYRTTGSQPLDPLFTDTEAIASSRLGLVGRTERMAAITTSCGGTLTWRCLGEQAGRPWAEVGGKEAWGTVKPAHASPVTDAVGLAVLGQASASWWAGEAPPVPADAINPSDFDGPFRDWFTQLERSIPDDAFSTAQTPLGILLTRPVFDVVGTTEAEAGAAPPPQPTVTYPEPVVNASAVVASTADGGLPGGDVTKVTAALQAAGWTAPPAPGPSGLPSPAVLISLQTLWKDVVR